MTDEQLNLLHRYLDGSLTEDELEPLESLLRESKEARSALRTFATIDAKWQQITAEKTTVSSQVLGSDMSSRPEPAAGRIFPIWTMITTIAAAILIAAMGWIYAPQKAQIEAPRGIARVIRIEGECFAGQHELGRVIQAGDELFHGENLQMDKGLIEFAFHETGVHVLTTAPLKTRLQDPTRLFLDKGEMKLVVPPQGVGFVVDTAERKFIDLGTSFVVTASNKGSEVLVLDGEIAVGRTSDTAKDIMQEGEFARFDEKGKLKKRSAIRVSESLPAMPLASIQPNKTSLRGKILAFDAVKFANVKEKADKTGNTILPFIKSKFRNESLLKPFLKSDPIRFAGIAGAFRELPEQANINAFASEAGWMAWYQGKVAPPRPGRYRFWGYADNHLVIAINGEPIFDGSRYDSSIKTLGIPRTDNPSLPCMIARAGFACGQWVELNGDPVQLDLMFGERGGVLTSGLLLIEREGDTYEETFWGQPKWPLFLTEPPTSDELAGFEKLKVHLEKEVMGSFSVTNDAVWTVTN